MSVPFTDSLRDKLRASMGICPTCGIGGMHQRQMARILGVSPATLCRFLAGKNPGAALVNKLVDFLGKGES